MERLDLLARDPLPLAGLIGVRFASADKDRILAEMTVTPELCTKPETLRGGAVMAFAVTVGAAGAVLNLPKGAPTTTLERKTNLVASAPVGTTITAKATSIGRGRRTMI